MKGTEHQSKGSVIEFFQPRREIKKAEKCSNSYVLGLAKGGRTPPCNDCPQKIMDQFPKCRNDMPGCKVELNHCGMNQAFQTYIAEGGRPGHSGKVQLGLLLSQPEHERVMSATRSTGVNEEDYVSPSQKLLGKPNPKFLIPPVVVPPILDNDYWKTNNLVVRTGINATTPFDEEASGYVPRDDGMCRGCPEGMAEASCYQLPNTETCDTDPKPIIPPKQGYEYSLPFIEEKPKNIKIIETSEIGVADKDVIEPFASFGLGQLQGNIASQITQNPSVTPGEGIIVRQGPSDDCTVVVDDGGLGYAQGDTFGLVDINDPNSQSVAFVTVSSVDANGQILDVTVDVCSGVQDGAVANQTSFSATYTPPNQQVTATFFFTDVTRGVGAGDITTSGFGTGLVLVLDGDLAGIYNARVAAGVGFVMGDTVTVSQAALARAAPAGFGSANEDIVFILNSPFVFGPQDELEPGNRFPDENVYLLNRKNPRILPCETCEDLIDTKGVLIANGYDENNLTVGLPTNFPASECGKSPATAQFNVDTFTSTIVPGVYQNSQVIEPINANIGISFTAQIPPTTISEQNGELLFEQHDPNIYIPPEEKPPDQSPNTANVYDPRLTGHGSSNRSYNDPMTGQTRFYYKDVDAIRMPNYIVRSKIDVNRWADTYGPAPDGFAHGNPETHNIRNLANNAFVDATIEQRTSLMQSLMRKRNSELYQMRLMPQSNGVSSSALGGSGGFRGGRHSQSSGTNFVA
tara:strand:+ start:5808 stop:8042 length:2235 start_codon:yes stop_codon:yes gene_type:complete